MSGIDAISRKSPHCSVQISPSEGHWGRQRLGVTASPSYLDFVHSVISDFRCDIVELVVEQPKAFARMRFSGFHRGELFGFQPTGKPVEWAGATLFTFSRRQIADLWVLGDVHGLLRLLEQNALG
jgi:predicted ester cyclase